MPAHIGIRTKDYKLLLFYGASENSNTPTTPPGWELYDLNKDPNEDYNVYDNPKYTNIINTLKSDLKSIRAKHGFDGPQYPFNEVIEAFWDYDAVDYKKAILISGQSEKIIMGRANEKKKNKKLNVVRRTKQQKNKA